MAQQPNWVLRHPIVEVSISHTIRHTHTHTHTYGRIPPNKRSASCRGRYLHNTKDEYPCPQGDSTSKIQTHNPSTQTATYLCLRPQCHNISFQTHFSFLYFTLPTGTCSFLLPPSPHPHFHGYKNSPQNLFANTLSLCSSILHLKILPKI